MAREYRVLSGLVSTDVPAPRPLAFCDDLAVNGAIPDLSALTPLLQGFVPPPLHDVRFAAKVADNGGAVPAVSSLSRRSPGKAQE